MKENNKLKNTRIVKITEDFNPGAQRGTKEKPVVGKVLYKKGSKHAIHVKLLSKLKDKGLKYSEERVDFAALKAKAAIRLKDRREGKK